jgi:hypothetical protein
MATPPAATGIAPANRNATDTATFLPLAVSTAAPTALPWYLTRGGPKLDQGWGVDVDAAGNIYFAAHQQEEGEFFTDMVVYKFDAAGQELWQTRWGGPFTEKAFVVTAGSQAVYVGGLTHVTAGLDGADMAVLALDPVTGNLLWEFTWDQGFGYEEVDGLVQDGDALYISGWTTGETTGNDAALLKLDLAGDLVWANTWGGEGWDQADGQLVVDGTAIYIAGRYGAANIFAGGQGYLARFDKASGDYQDHRLWGGPLFTDALGLTSDGEHLYAVGLTLDEGNGGQIFLRKYSKELELVWEQLWGGPGGESARAVVVDPSGDILVAGESDSPGGFGDLDVALLRYGAAGNLLYSQRWGGTENDKAHGLALWNGRALIAGQSHSFGQGQEDALLISLDASTGSFPPP